MTLIVEDGTGLADAESYISVADTDAYFTKLNNAAWTGTTPVKEAALRKATSYLDSVYRWNGSIFSTTQALNFPRNSIVDIQGRDLSGTVPKKIKDATCELALASLSGELVKVKSSNDYVKRKKVGSLEIEYKDDAPTDRQYSYVDSILEGLFSGRNSQYGNISLVRN